VTNESEVKGFVVDIDKLPLSFPTHRHDPASWEALGRCCDFRILKRDEIWSNRHRALILCLSMIFSENRFTLFRIML